jgi:acetyltransferase-like isoleucine patch superfamily enzyme
LRAGAWIAEDTVLGQNVTVLPGAVLGRPPVSTKAQARQAGPQLPPLVVGDNCVIGANAVIYRGTTIGANTLVGDTACIREQVRIGDSCIIAMGVTVNYNTTIGSRVKIMDSSHITGNTLIEDDVFISLLVGSANDNSMGREAARNLPVGQRDRRGVVIRRFARVGEGALLLPGVEVGENAVVAAGSVVNRSVPPRTVVFGAPARPVRVLREDEILK